MSTNSTRVRGTKSRVNSLQQDARLQRGGSYSRRRIVTPQEAWSYALRAAYLTYLLQPRARRVQHVPAAPKPLQKSSTSVTDLVRDFSLIRDSKSTKFPHAFMSALDKRLTGILIGKEKMPEFSDPTVKRTFAVFLNEFKNPTFRKSMEQDRRVEDLLLIFFSNATKELQKGKAPDDDSWRLMVDRHVALFVRLIISIFRDHDWAKDRPELWSRLQTMEKKMLIHDQDLTASSQRNGGAGGQTVEVEVPLSYEVRDMPLVMSLIKIFGRAYDDVQAEINQHKSIWTEQAALQDLKIYQTHLSLNGKRTLSSDDFDLEDAYETWKKTEIPDVSQMMLAIVQSNLELAKTNTAAGLPQFKATGNGSVDSGYSDMSRKMSESTDGSSYVIDQPVDMSGLTLEDNHAPEQDETPYTFIPPDPRAYYRAVVKQAFTADSQDPELDGSESSRPLFSKASTEILSEIALRWRVPQFSRLVLFLDVVREKYQHQEIDINTLNSAFIYLNEPQLESKKSHRMSTMVQASLFDRTKWTIADYALNQNILTSIHDALLRDFFEIMLHAYDSKVPSYGLILFILETHIYPDPLFNKSSDDLDQFWTQLQEALRQRAEEVYGDMLRKILPGSQEEWEFYHVIQLGKDVLQLGEKIQKRFRKLPPSVGVSPVMILMEAMLPAYAGDAGELIKRILDQAQAKEEQIPIQDAFDLYKELVQIREIHFQAVPGKDFAMDIEGLLQDFVWRWIDSTDANIIGWVDGAVKLDQFQVRTEFADQVANDDERHSVSVIDVFRSFNQAIESIANLNWNDRFQHAKFMTRLSKSVGTGVARYCELIEQMFIKEMDRMTPEQETAAQRTRQQKWMQMARDAWANQERIEPFQFLPESLVKVNNIEYAMQQLDKLEHEIDVDALAEVIQQNTPPVTQRARQTTNYVFTIKIIEAEDLKACDMNGLSDPYVVLGDEYQKRLAKTRVIYSNLNPRWDETIDIVTQGPLNIIATIWDWDTLGDHDCVGRTSLKLDPSHFRDYLPREYWLDLDTQGRLLLRVSMEGERDDIQFYFGKAFRTLKRTERDMTRNITDKLSAYINHCLSRRALKALLSRGISFSNVSGFFNRQSQAMVQQGPTKTDIENALAPLFTYFNENFAIMEQTLTSSAKVMVMTRVWKEVLVTIESLLVPPLSDKLSQQRPLTQQEMDIVFKWLQLLFDFFHALDEETGLPDGVPLDVLKSPKWHELQSLNFFYFEPSDSLIRTSEAMASATAARHQEQQARLNRLSAPAALAGAASHQFGGAAGLVGIPSRRHKTIMLSRNLGTMKKAKEEKRKEAQADPNDDMIMRILRMRPEAERYLKDRSRQKERLAAAAAAEMIVRQSLNAGGGRMVGTLGKR